MTPAAWTVRAPGKVVISGAYAVLEGAPGIVAAADRWVYAAAAPGDRCTEEVAMALRARGLPESRAPRFEAGELRHEGRKLGLGSSAAILVASLGALELEQTGDAGALGARVEAEALAAHHRAQGGGSGLDVHASARGGVLQLEVSEQARRVTPLVLPAALSIAVYAEPRPASTPALVRAVRALQERDPRGASRLLDAQAKAADAAARACAAGDPEALVAALSAQHRALAALGAAAGVPIVTAAVASVARDLAPAGVAVLPSGAGGGDLVLLASVGPLPEQSRSRPAADGWTPLPLTLGVPGVHSLLDPPGR